MVPGQKLPSRKSVLCLDQYYFFSRLYRLLNLKGEFDGNEYNALVGEFVQTFQRTNSPMA
jgi:hypothetical protein